MSRARIRDVCLVTWSLSESEAGVDCFDTNLAVFYMLHLHMEAVRFLSNQFTPASLPNKGQATKHTTLKWDIVVRIFYHVCFVFTA